MKESMISIAKTPDSEWQRMRRLYPFYGALARESALEVAPCKEMEEAFGTPSAEMLAAARRWFDGMDEHIQIHQLRHFIQTSEQANETTLGALLAYHLSKEQRHECDRDKVDFLLVQFFSQRAPSEISGPSLSLAEAGAILEPALGKIDAVIPQELAVLEDLLDKAHRARSLNELFTARIIEQGRQIKTSCGDKFFEPAAMVAFARFGFLVRRAFFRLMHQDLNVILDGLQELEAQGLTTLDCRKAQFAADEPIARLRMICLSWKVMFHAEYSAGQPLCILVDLRTAVESALAHSARRRGTQAKGAAAGAEFEVASAPAARDSDNGS